MWEEERQIVSEERGCVSEQYIVSEGPLKLTSYFLWDRGGEERKGKGGRRGERRESRRQEVLKTGAWVLSPPGIGSS